MVKDLSTAPNKRYLTIIQEIVDPQFQPKLLDWGMTIPEVHKKVRNAFMAKRVTALSVLVILIDNWTSLRVLTLNFTVLSLGPSRDQDCPRPQGQETFQKVR